MKNGGLPLILLGVYLMLAGVAGYLSNPAGAKTALMSGGTFGALCLVWGFLVRSGFGWARLAGLATVALLVAAFAWRASVGWMAVASGDSGKLFAASLISSMLVAAVITGVAVVRSRRS